MSLASPGMSLTSPGMSLPSPAMTSPCPSGILPSPASLTSPAVSLPSLQSPMTPCLDDRNPNSSVSSSASSSNLMNSATNCHLNNNNIFTSSTFNSSLPSSSISPTASMLGLSSFNQNNLFQKLNQNHGSTHPLHQLGQFFGTNGGFGGVGFGLGLKGPLPHRNPVGANPHDINNPLSVNQLTNNNNHSSSSSSAGSNSSSGRQSASSSSSNSSSKNTNSNNDNGQKLQQIIKMEIPLQL